MSRQRLTLLLALAALTVPSARSAGPPQPFVQVEVRFTVKEFDPRGKKEGAMECVVINHSARPIRVPLTYSPRFDSDVVVFGRVGTDKKTIEHYSYYWDLRLFKRPTAGGASSKETQAVVAPGKEAVVFNEGLNELLLDRKKSGWSWQA